MMRRVLAACLLAAAGPATVLAAAGPATAAPFTGSLTVYVFGTQQALPAVVFGSGDGTSPASGVTLPGDVFVGTATATTPISAAPPITGNSVVVTGHGSGSFAGAPLAGTMPLGGTLSLFVAGGVPVFQVPLAVVGAPGGVGTWASGGIALTALGTGWSAGTVMATVPISLSDVFTTTFAGYDDRVGGVGTLQLVTPIRVDSNVTEPQVFWASLRLTFVPEPSTALLLCTGTLGLAALGRLRAAVARLRAASSAASLP